MNQSFGFGNAFADLLVRMDGGASFAYTGLRGCCYGAQCWLPLIRRDFKLQFIGEIQVTRYKDTRYVKNLTATSVSISCILYRPSLLGAYLVSLC